MRASLLTALGIWAIGCVIPTPLEAEVSLPHQPPVIVGGDPEFLKSPVTHANSDRWSFGVRASDEDTTQTLTARLYFKVGDFLSSIGSDLVLVATDATDPRVRTGSFPQAALCESLQSTGLPGPEYLVFVYVADVAFPFDVRNLPAGHFDFKYWVLDCK